MTVRFAVGVLKNSRSALRERKCNRLEAFSNTYSSIRGYKKTHLKQTTGLIGCMTVRFAVGVLKNRRSALREHKCSRLEAFSNTYGSIRGYKNQTFEANDRFDRLHDS